MDGDPPVPADRGHRHGIQPAGRHPGRLCAGALAISRQERCSTAVIHLPLVLPPVVTGYILLDAARAARHARRLARRTSRHRVLVPLDRRGARLRRHGLSAAWCGRSGCRSRRSTGGSKTPPARSAPTPLWTFASRHPAAGAARRDGRRDPVLCQGARRIRRHHHLRLQYSRRDADALGRDLYLYAGSGRRRRCVAADRRSRS